MESVIEIPSKIPALRCLSLTRTELMKEKNLSLQASGYACATIRLSWYSHCNPSCDRTCVRGGLHIVPFACLLFDYRVGDSGLLHSFV